jgi:two-component system, chemotaxis family, chemotaxis protein CheY
MSGQARVWGADPVHRVAAKAEQPAVAPPRLLAIDSDGLHRMLICRAADKAGYLPAGAANLTEAAKLVQTTIFDCIVLDLSFGQQTGEMLRRLREIDYPTTILIVGNREAAGCRETLRFAKSLGLNVGELVCKPVDFGMLRYTLEQLKVQRTLQRGLAAVSA